MERGTMAADGEEAGRLLAAVRQNVRLWRMRMST